MTELYIPVWEYVKSENSGRQKAEGRRQKAEGRRQGE
jgi:hypothetical protein